MQVPLKAETYVSDGSQKIKIWSNGTSTVVDSPIKPYFYSPEVIPTVKCTKVDMSLLYDTEYTGDIFKCEFRNVNDLRKSASKRSWESRVRFMDKIYIDKPEFIMQYPNTEELKILSLDIETDSFQTFPNANENCIIAIGLQLNDEPIEIYMSKTYNSDRALLLEVMARIKKMDPDIFVSYNGIRFDFPYITKRLAINRISNAGLSRDGTEIEHVEDQEGVLKETKIGGRLHYDIMKRSVKDNQKVIDQNLFGESPKHYDMKTVSKIYNCPNVIKEPPEIMSNMRSIVNTKQLHDYLESDIRCTTHLRKIYLPAIIKMAEILQVSLESTIKMTPSYTGSMLFARKFKALGIIGDKTVGEAYPVLNSRKQGALVKTYRTGLFKDGLKDIDVKSYYPSLILQLNLSPEVTKILRTEPELKPFSTSVTEDNHLQLSIPDEKANCQIIVDIDRNRRGIASSFVEELMRDRAELKRRLKDLDRNSPEYSDLDANQMFLKLVLNSMTGYFSAKYSLFGSFASYVSITGSGRYILQKIKDFLDSDGNSNCISCNTDGLYLTDGPTLDETHEWLEPFLKDLFHCDKSHIWLEETEFASGYFQPDTEKHYLLLTMPDKNGNQRMITHGGGLKSGSKIQLYSDVIDNIGLKMLTTGVTKADVEKYYNTENWTLDKLTFNRNVKQKNTYKNSNEIGVQLICQYEDRFETTLNEPTRLSYVKIKQSKQAKKRDVSAYKLVTIFDTLEDVSNIDDAYYISEVDKALERLSLSNLCPKNRTYATSLFDF
jgi:DNA polymerase elongation subunit (family B)